MRKRDLFELRTFLRGKCVLAVAGVFALVWCRSWATSQRTSQRLAASEAALARATQAAHDLSAALARDAAAPWAWRGAVPLIALDTIAEAKAAPSLGGADATADAAAAPQPRGGAVPAVPSWRVAAETLGGLQGSDDAAIAAAPQGRVRLDDDDAALDGVAARLAAAAAAADAWAKRLACARSPAAAADCVAEAIADALDASRQLYGTAGTRPEASAAEAFFEASEAPPPPARGCLSGSTLEEQVAWVVNETRGRAAIYGVAAYEHALEYPALQSVCGALRSYEVWRGFSFVVAADAASLAALCAAGLPAVGTSDSVISDAAALLGRVFADTARRFARRGLASGSGAPASPAATRRRRLAQAGGSPQADAALFESIPEGSTFDEMAKADEVQPLRGGLSLRGASSFRDVDDSNKERAVHDVAAVLARRGVDSVFMDIDAAFVVGGDDDAAAPAALAGWLQAHALSMPTRQRPSRVACEEFMVARRGNETAEAVDRLGAAARSARTALELARLQAHALRLGSANPAALPVYDVACGPRPRLLAPRRLAAVILGPVDLADFAPAAGVPSRAAARICAARGREALAKELGVWRPRAPPTYYGARTKGPRSSEGARIESARGYVGLWHSALGNAVSLYEPRTHKSARYLRCVVAYAVAAAMVTGRALWLPTVHSDETQFFAWSYLDLQSVEALGVDWREAAFVRNRGRRRPFDGVATLDVGGNEPLPPGRARTIVTVDVRPDLAAPPRQRNATATDDADDDAAADAAYGARRTVLRLSTRAPRDDDSLVWVAARLQSAELLLLRPTFLEHDHAQLRGSPTSIVGDVMRRLRWCDKALQPAKDVGVVTPASSCWGARASHPPGPARSRRRCKHRSRRGARRVAARVGP